jgi:hypothetical protein
MYRQLKKAHNHDHFFTYKNAVHESYRTIRGLRCRPIVGIEYPDKDKLCEIDILIINSELINNKVTYVDKVRL